MRKTGKKAILAALLIICLLPLCGCDSVNEALSALGRAYESDVETPKSPAGDVDWSYVPLLRECAQRMLLEAAPDIEITETAVASKNGTGERVIVVVEYKRDGKSGKYGFDYKRNAAGEYELTRYGEGVKTDDL